VRGVNPGRYRHRVSVEEQVEAQDAATGAITRAWVPVALGSSDTAEAIPANVLTGPGREAQMAGTMQHEAPIRVAFRWFPGLTTKMRLVWDGKPYNILSIETDETARREYRVACSGGVNDGGN
jgi:head-tail adaptor